MSTAAKVFLLDERKEQSSRKVESECQNIEQHDVGTDNLSVADESVTREDRSGLLCWKAVSERNRSPKHHPTLLNGDTPSRMGRTDVLSPSKSWEGTGGYIPEAQDQRKGH